MSLIVQGVDTSTDFMLDVKDIPAPYGILMEILKNQLSARQYWCAQIGKINHMYVIHLSITGWSSTWEIVHIILLGK